jgi:hypothetical protein
LFASDSTHHVFFCNFVDKENEDQRRRQRTSGGLGSEKECFPANTSWCSENEPRKGERLSPEPKGREAEGTKAKEPRQEVMIQKLTIQVHKYDNGYENHYAIILLLAKPEF